MLLLLSRSASSRHKSHSMPDTPATLCHLVVPCQLVHRAQLRRCRCEHLVAAMCVAADGGKLGRLQSADSPADDVGGDAGGSSTMSGIAALCAARAARTFLHIGPSSWPGVTTLTAGGA